MKGLSNCFSSVRIYESNTCISSIITVTYTAIVFSLRKRFFYTNVNGVREMKANILKSKVRTNTFSLVLLSLLTLGIYNAMWLFKNNSVIEDILEDKVLDHKFIIVLAALMGWSSFLSAETDFATVGALLSMLSGVVYIIWAFKAKRLIQNMMLNDYKIDYSMNSIYTFFFNIYYINYCINELEEDIKKSKVLSDKS